MKINEMQMNTAAEEPIVSQNGALANAAAPPIQSAQTNDIRKGWRAADLAQLFGFGFVHRVDLILSLASRRGCPGRRGSFRWRSPA
jgi:hypothetical protein